MEEEVFISLFAVGIVLLFCFRIAYRLIAPEELAGDAYGQLLQIKDIKKAGHRRPKKPSKSAINGYYAYPYFALWLLSFLPKRWLNIVERYFSGIMDVILAFGFLLLLKFNYVSFEGVLIGLVILIATPQFMRPDYPHGRGLSSRKPGIVLGTFSLFSFFYWVSSGSDLWFVAAVLLGGAMVLTSKFALQAYIFILGPTAIFYHRAAFVLLLLSLMAATIGSKGRYIRILSSHLGHIQSWATTRQYKRFDHGIPSPMGFGQKLLHMDSMKNKLDFLRKSRRLRALADNPFLFLSIIVIFLVGWQSEAIPTGYVIWSGMTFIAFILISLPHFLFLGQADRYLEFGLFPSVVLIDHGLHAFGKWYKIILLFVILLGVGIELVYVQIFNKFFTNKDWNKSINEAIDELNKLERGVVLAQPVGISRQVALKTDHTVVQSLGGSGSSTDEAIKTREKLFPNNYNFVTDDIQWLKNEFDPDYVIYDLSDISDRDLKEDELKPPKSSPIFKNGYFELYTADSVFSEFRSNC